MTEPIVEDNRPDDTEVANAEPASGELTLSVSLGSAHFESRGDGPSVLAAFNAFRDFYSASAPNPGPTGAAEATAATESHAKIPDSGARDGAGASEGGDFVPLSVFLSHKKMPRGNKLIVLGIAVWAQAHKGDTVFTADSIKTYWRDSKKKMPANLNRDIADAASEGWLERLATGQGNYGLTSYGEAHFNGLPKADE